MSTYTTQASIMPARTIALSGCLLLVSVCGSDGESGKSAADPGLEFVMDLHPDNFYCARLQCSVKIDPTEEKVLSVIGMTIYDASRTDSHVKLASVSTFEPDLYVDKTRTSAPRCNGVIYEDYANVTIDLRNDIDCLYGVYMCQLDFVTGSGASQVVRETVSPETNHSFSRITTVLNKLDKIEGQLKDISENVVDKRGFLLNNISEQNQSDQNLTSMDEKLDLLLSGMESFCNVSLIQKSKCEQCPVCDPRSQKKTVEAHLPTTCYRGMPHHSPWQIFLLWGRIPTLCDTVTDGGGWIIFQRRTSGDIGFKRLWHEYKIGFGSVHTDYWLGNDNIHNLTSQGYHNLRIDMKYNGTQYYAQYSIFDVGNEKSKYQLTVTGYNGTAGDSLMYHNGMYFSTSDYDNDRHSETNCASKWKSGWWYNICHASHLNGVWEKTDGTGVDWDTIGDQKHLSSTEMKIRL